MQLQSSRILQLFVATAFCFTTENGAAADKDKVDHGTTNVTMQVGEHAFLPCLAQQIGKKSVSWVRVRDGHIISVDRVVFIADERFQAVARPDKYWQLQIKYVQARDAGLYECQVSIDPKVFARVHLHVVVPRTELVGDPDRYVKAGSTVVVRCVVRGAIDPPMYIIWYQGPHLLIPETRPGVSTHFDMEESEIDGGYPTAVGTLVFEYARKSDSGNYTCSPSNSRPVTVQLHVISGESSPWAVTSAATSKMIKSWHGIIIIFVLIFLKT